MKSNSHPIELSIIICTYNRCEYLKDVLSSLAGQADSLPFNVEILIVDNNSNDGTRALGEEYAENHSAHFRYVFEGKQGKTFALNRGISEAKGGFLVFTDDDVTINPGWIESIKKSIDEHPECRAFGGNVTPIWPEKVPKWITREGPYMITGGPLVHHDNGNRVRSYHEEGMYAPCGANMYFHESIFSDYGTFDTSLNYRVRKVHMNEDTEFCFRLLDNNEEILYIPEVKVYHPVFPGRLEKRYFRNYYFKSGRAITLMNILSRGKDSFKRTFLNVPLYIYRTTFERLMKYLMSLFTLDYKKILFHELRLIHSIGQLYEHLTYTADD